MSSLDSLPSLDTGAAPTSWSTSSSRLAPVGRGGDDPAKAAGKDFESYFMTSMLESMSAGIKTNKLFGGGQGEALYRSLLNQEYGKAIAAHGGLGIAEAVQREILSLQQKASS